MGIELSLDVETPMSDDDRDASRETSATTHVKVWNETWRVENEEGAWQGEPVMALDFLSTARSPVTTVFHEEGAYEGLTAIVEVQLDGTGWDLQGIIIGGDLPPDPEPSSID